MSFWTDEKVHKLVYLYSKFSNLWNRKHNCYENLRARYESYSEILASLTMPIYVSVSDVICKLKELRNIYVYELQKIEIAARSGCIYNPDHTWFGIMNEFLYDHLDADEKLAELSSSEEGAASSEEILEMCQTKNCSSDSNSVSDSDSDGSLNPVRNELSLKKICGRFKPPKKSQAYFLRSPTVLRSTKMNTKYEFPRKVKASSMPVKNVCSQKRTSRTLDMEQCVQLDVKMTSSDVSIKYLRTESVNGDEKRYKKNLKAPRCSIDKPPCFKNMKMMISKSGYTATNLERKSSEAEDKDAEFWEMMSMLDLGVPCPLTKLEATYSSDSNCSSVTKIKSNPTCCYKKICEDINDENRVEKIIEAVDATKRKCETSKERFCGRQSCCSKLKQFKECKDLKKQDKTLKLEPCTKKMKVMCLGDGTLFDDNLLELLQDLSIKICPFDGCCASGNCASDDPDDVFDNFLQCETCSLATRPVKEYEIDAPGSAASNDTESVPSNHMTAENISEVKTNSGILNAAASEGKPVDVTDVSKSNEEPEVGSENPGLENDDNEKIKDTDLAASNIEEKKKDGSLIPQTERNYEVRVMLESADSGSSSAKDAIFHEAKKELSEAGKLYNGGKYITGSRIEESVEFDYFGAQVALSLKMMGKQRAMKLKKIIAETLQGEKIKKF